MDSPPLNGVYDQLDSAGSESSKLNAAQDPESHIPIQPEQLTLGMGIHNIIERGLVLEAENTRPIGFSLTEKLPEPDSSVTESSSPKKQTRRRRSTSKADLTGHTWSFDVNKKGNPLLFINSYHFRMDKGVYGPGFGAERLLPTNSYNWICVISNCKVRANTRGQELYHLTSHEHLHDTQVNESAVRRIEALVHNAAKRSREDADELITRLQAENPDIFAGVDMAPSHIRNVVKKARPRAPARAEVRDLASLDIPKHHSSTLRGSVFLQYLSPVDKGNSRFLIFSTERNFEMLSTSAQWYIDASFSACPKPFQDVVIISAEVGSKLMPLVYCMLPNQLQSTFSDCFSFVLGKVIHPSSVSMDFDPVQHSVLKKLLPNATFHGSFFYFRQALYRRIYGEAILRQFNNLPATSNKLRMLLALAYVPPQAMQSFFSTILSDPFFVKHQTTLTPLLEYMARTWIGYFNSDGAWRQPRIQLSWNCFYDAIHKCTSNKKYTEHLHTALNDASRTRGVSLNSFCEYILAQQELVDADLDLVKGGTSPLPREYSAAAKREFDLHLICSAFNKTSDKAALLENLTRVLIFGGHQITTTYDPASDAAISK